MKGEIIQMKGEIILDNKANLAVIKVLAEYFKVPKSKVILVREKNLNKKFLK